MASNTKLTKEQKQDLKTIKMEYGDKLGLALVGRVTVACYRINPELVRFTTSIASRDEKKIRPKVGEYNAIMRLEANQHALAIFPSNEWETLDEVACNIGNILDW